MKIDKTAILFLTISVLCAFLAPVGDMFMPLMIILGAAALASVYRVGYFLFAALFIALAAAVNGFFFVDFLDAALIGAGIILTGYMCGFALQTKQSLPKATALVSLCYIAAMSVVAAIIRLSDINVYKIVYEAVRAQPGFNEIKNFGNIYELVMNTMPAIMIYVSVVLAYATIRLSKLFMVKLLGEDSVILPKFSEIRITRLVLILNIFSTLFWWLAKSEDLKNIWTNVLLLLNMYFFIAGISFAAFFIQKVVKRKGSRIYLYILLCMLFITGTASIIVMSAFILAAILDCVLNFRGRIMKRGDKDGE